MRLPLYLASVALALAASACSAAPNHSQANGKSAGKPGAIVEVQLKSSGKTASGATLPLQLEFKTGRGNATLDVEYRTEGPLSLQTASRTQLTTDQNGIATDTPNVLALGDGTSYLNVFVTLGKQSRAISIPVTVGDVPQVLKPAGKTATTPQGENLIILPAEDGKR